MELNWIQRHAMAILIRGESVRVGAMRPDGVTANLFTYHLEGLVHGGIIEKTGRGLYRLTGKGMHLAGTFSTATDRPSENLKTVIMLYAVKGGKRLLFRWSRQPYLGRVTPAYDRMAYGCSRDEAVQTALVDKLGVTCQAEYMASALIRIESEGVIVSHMTALIYRVDIAAIELPFVGRNGEAFLSDRTPSDAVDGLDDFMAQLDRGEALLESTWQLV